MREIKEEEDKRVTKQGEEGKNGGGQYYTGEKTRNCSVIRVLAQDVFFLMPFSQGKETSIQLGNEGFRIFELKRGREREGGRKRKGQQPLCTGDKKRKRGFQIDCVCHPPFPPGERGGRKRKKGFSLLF